MGLACLTEWDRNEDCVVFWAKTQNDHAYTIRSKSNDSYLSKRRSELGRLLVNPVKIATSENSLYMSFLKETPPNRSQCHITSTEATQPPFIEAHNVETTVQRTKTESFEFLLHVIDSIYLASLVCHDRL